MVWVKVLGLGLGIGLGLQQAICATHYYMPKVHTRNMLSSCYLVGQTVVYILTGGLFTCHIYYRIGNLDS